MGLIVSIFCALPHFRGKQRLLLLFFRWVPFSRARSFYGVKMTNNIMDSTWRACMSGSYGEFIYKYIRGLHEDFVFFDIGANQGLFGLYAAKNPSCRSVVSIEPNPFTFAMLAQNTLLSKDREKIHLICAALCTSEVTSIKMNVPIYHSGASSMVIEADPDSRLFSALSTPANIFEEILGELSNKNIHAKIDVEGAEILVLNELNQSGMLEKISSIIIEVSDKTKLNGASEIIDFFDNLGWKLVGKSGNSDHYDAIFMPSKSPL